MPPRVRVMQGDKQVKVTAAQARAIEANSVDIRACFCERSLTVTFGMDPSATVADAQTQAQTLLTAHISNAYSSVPNMDIDPDCTDISPTPDKLDQRIGALGSDIVFTFWPVNRGTSQKMDDTPIASQFSRITAKELLQENPPKPPQPSNDVKELIREAIAASEERAKHREAELTRALAKSRTDLQWAITASEERAKHREAELTQALAKSRTEFEQLNEVVRQGLRIIFPLARRCLLDDAREMVAKLVGKSSWFILIKDTPPEKLRAVITKALEGQVVLGQPLHEFEGFVSLIQDGLSIRNAGNHAAHNVPQHVVKDAVMALDNSDRQLLRFAFAWVHNEDVDWVALTN